MNESFEQQGSRKVIVEPVPMLRDHRGWLFEPLDEALIQGKRNVHLVGTLPGQIRGNHSHLKGTEILVVTGPARVVFQEGAEPREVSVPADEAWRFIIPPLVPHAIQNMGENLMLLLAFNTEVHDRRKPDTVPARLIEG